jgi:hypothetical protein
MEYDFGVVRPSGEYRHVFSIENTEEQSWIIKKIHSPCSCTCSSTTSSVIGPGKTELIEVVYKPGKQAGDAKRSVLVELVGLNAPRVRLTLKARVRSPVSLQPPELTLGEVGKRSPIERTVHVSNFSSADWKSLTVQSSAQWLTAELEPIPTGDHDTTEGQPRQVWRMVVCVDTTEDMPSGQYESQLEVTAHGSDELRAAFSVKFDLAPPVVAMPDQLFFGTVAAGTSVTRRIVIRFTDDAVPQDRATVVVRTNGPAGLTCEWSNSEGRCWELMGTYQPPATEGIIRGSVDIEIPTTPPTLLLIPVRAIVKGK